MVSLTDLKQAARVVKGEQGNPVAQVPLAMWESVMGKEPEPEKPKPSQMEQIKALLEEWANDPEYQAIPESWWDDFQQSLKENRDWGCSKALNAPG